MGEKKGVQKTIVIRKGEEADSLAESVKRYRQEGGSSSSHGSLPPTSSKKGGAREPVAETSERQHLGKRTEGLNSRIEKNQRALGEDGSFRAQGRPKKGV